MQIATKSATQVVKKVLNALPSLQTTLKSDSLVCALYSIVLVLGAKPIAKLLIPNAPVLFGLTLPKQLEILGIGVLFVGAVVYSIASQRPINPVAVGSIIFLEAIWIVASAILLVQAAPVLTLAGKLFIILSASAMLVFMLLEIYGLKELMLESRELKS
jgi:Na+-driven multidrug efflux pump